MTDPTPKPPSRDPGWIETETVRDPGANLGPGIFLLGLALIIVLVAVLGR